MFEKENHAITSELQEIINSKYGDFLDLTLFDLSHFVSLRNKVIWLQEYSKKYIYTKQIKIITRCTLDETPNAFAYSSSDPSNKFDFIGINAGLIFSVFDTCNRLMSLSSFLPEIGNSQNENSERAKLPYWNSNSILQERNSIFPQDPVRFSFAQHLTEMIISFVFLHELTHLKNGHLEFIRSKNNVLDLSEIDIDSKQIESYALRQALEVDADTGAICLLLDLYLRTDAQLPSHADNEHRDALLHFSGTYENILRSCVISSNIFFRLFDAPEIPSYTSNQTSHPYLPLRQAISNESLSRYLAIKRIPGISYVKSKEYAEIFVKEIECAMSEIISEEPDHSKYISTESEIYKSNIASYMQTLISITPELERNMRGVRLAPFMDNG